MVSADGGRTYWELDDERLSGYPIRLEMFDLLLNGVTIPAFHSHPTYVDSHPRTGIEILAETGTWKSVSTITRPQGPLADDGTQIVSMEGNLTSLSVFAPFDTSVAGIEDSDTSESDTSNTLTGGTGGSEARTGSGDGGGTGNDSTTDDALADGSFGGTGVTDSSESEGLLSAMASRSPSVVWVDFAFLGDEFGTEDRPFNSFAEALAVVDIGGVIMAKAGASNETPTFAQAVTVNAVGGPVQVGDPSATQLPGLEGAVIAAFDSSRSFPGFTLLGIEFQTLVQKLGDAGALIFEISTLDSASLDGVDIFFSGLHDTGGATAAEQNTLLAFVQAGGGLIAFTERIGFAVNNNPITSPFGVTGVGLDRDDLTTITQLAHPVMNGRFGAVDNAGNVYDPERPGGFNPSPAQVLATTVDAEGAILALETGSGKAVFFNDISFLSDNFLFDGAGNLPAIMNAFLYVYNTPIPFQLSFDDGPNALAGSGNNTREVNAVLNARGIKAAFFVQTHVSFRGGDPEGQQVIQEIHAAGHRIEVHTGSDDDHVAHTVRVIDDAYDANGDMVIDEQDGANALEGDLIRAKIRIAALTGRTPTLVRPPFGDSNGAVLNTYASQNLIMKLWDVDSGDSHGFHTPTTPRQDSIDYIHNELRNGGGGIVNAFNAGSPPYVVLFHDINGYTSEELEGHLQEMELIVEEELGRTAVFDDWPVSP